MQLGFRMVLLGVSAPGLFGLAMYGCGLESGGDECNGERHECAPALNFQAVLRDAGSPLAEPSDGGPFVCPNTEQLEAHDLRPWDLGFTGESFVSGPEPGRSDVCCYDTVMYCE